MDRKARNHLLGAIAERNICEVDLGVLALGHHTKGGGTTRSQVGSSRQLKARGHAKRHVGRHHRCCDYQKNYCLLQHRDRFSSCCQAWGWIGGETGFGFRRKQAENPISRTPPNLCMEMRPPVARVPGYPGTRVPGYPGTYSLLAFYGCYCTTQCCAGYCAKELGTNGDDLKLKKTKDYVLLSPGMLLGIPRFFKSAVACQFHNEITA
eukprot:2458935-Rhodomonas_salina.2